MILVNYTDESLHQGTKFPKTALASNQNVTLIGYRSRFVSMLQSVLCYSRKDSWGGRGGSDDYDRGDVYRCYRARAWESYENEITGVWTVPSIEFILRLSLVCVDSAPYNFNIAVILSLYSQDPLVY